MAGFEKTFGFQHIPSKTFPSFDAKSTKEHFEKWGLNFHMSVQMFSYDKYFQEYEKEKFAMSFFQDLNVQSNLKIPSKQNQWFPIGELNPTRVEAELVPATIISMEFFDRVFTDGLVRQSGAICKCYDEQIDDFLVSDELRKMFVSDESDFADIFSESEQNEFIFRIFKHICLGGSVCQYEDDARPYIDTTKFLYKDLVSVHKDSNTKELKVSSIVLKISAWAGEQMLFPGDVLHEQSFAYLVINPLKRNVTIWFHCWK